MKDLITILLTFLFAHNTNALTGILTSGFYGATQIFFPNDSPNAFGY